MTTVYCTVLPESLSLPDIDSLLLRLHAAEQEKLAHIRHADDRLRSLFAQLLLRSLLCQQFGIANDALNFERGQHGKPYLKHQICHFNLSHTPNCIAVAIASQPVGVDVEGPRKISARVAKRSFSPAEQHYVFASKTGWQQRFLLVWTRKEAYLKYMGTGLSKPLASFDTFDEPLSAQITGYHHQQYTLSICAETPPDHLRIVPWHALLQSTQQLAAYS